MNAERISGELVKLREGQNKSREQVAADWGVSVSAVAMYETGARIPRDEMKEKIAEYYNTTVGALFFA